MKDKECVCDKCLGNDPTFTFHVRGRGTGKLVSSVLNVDVNICRPCETELCCSRYSEYSFLAGFCVSKGIFDIHHWSKECYRKPRPVNYDEHSPIVNQKNNTALSENFTGGKEADNKEGLTWGFNSYKSHSKIAPSSTSDCGVSRNRLDLI